MHLVLGQGRFDHLIVDSGKKVLEAFQEGDYDIVLMDVQMPGMDGFISKPIDTGELFALIDKLVNEPPADQPNR